MTYKYVKSYRRTFYRGITYPIAICLQCKKIIEPSRIRLTNSKTHGDIYYVHEHELFFIELEQSNKGNRYVRVDEELRMRLPDLIEKVEQKWYHEDWLPEEVEELIRYNLEPEC